MSRGPYTELWAAQHFGCEVVRTTYNLQAMSVSGSETEVALRIFAQLAPLHAANRRRRAD